MHSRDENENISSRRARARVKPFNVERETASEPDRLPNSLQPSQDFRAIVGIHTHRRGCRRILGLRAHVGKCSVRACVSGKGNLSPALTSAEREN